MAAAKVNDKTIRIAQAALYPKELWWFIVSLIFLVSICHFMSLFISKVHEWGRPSKTTSDPEQGRGSPITRGVMSIRRIPPALVNAYRILAFRLTFSVAGWFTLNVAEIFLVVAYIIALWIWAMVNTTDMEGIKYDWHTYSNRAGALAASQTPLIVALSSKNNIITLLTGVSSEKLNYLHRMIARVIMVLLWLHGGSKLATGIKPGDLSSAWLRIGFTALISLTVLCVVGIKPVRAKAYEFFFWAHFSLIIIFLLGAFFHTKNFALQSYIWPCFLIWALDRFLRLVRVLYFKLLPYFPINKSRRQSGGFEATLDLLSPSLARVRLPCPKGFTWSPGQTAYLIAPGISRLKIEAHPFSIASIPGPEVCQDEIVFLIKARDGFTQRLAQKAAAGKGQKVTAFIDGPYGVGPNLQGSDQIVFIAGGSGITFTLPLLLSAISDARKNKSDCRKITFVWAIRDLSHLQWISSAMVQALSDLPEYLTVKVLVHVTNTPIAATKEAEVLPKLSSDLSKHEPPSRKPSSESLDNGKVASSVEYSAAKSEMALSVMGAEVKEGRPDLAAVLKDEIDNAAPGGSLSVVVCGSHGMARDVRSALVINPVDVVKGAPSVNLHVEAFGYA